MNNILISAVLVLGLIYSWKDKSKQKNDYKETEKIEKWVEQNPSASKVLVLDNGKPLVANIETTKRVEKMIDLISSFTDKDNVIAYSIFTENLKTEFSLIFQRCTMKGDAHKQSHNFLTPTNDVFETLSSTDIKEYQES
tara:strand:+ start:14428 stop:14844 length:417 start_codon:yes stop_codon:yes gene_type:complete